LGRRKSPRPEPEPGPPAAGPAGSSELAELARRREELTQQLIERAEGERATLARRIGELDAELGALTRQRRLLEKRLRGLGVAVEAEPEPEDYETAYRSLKRERDALQRERDELQQRVEGWERVFFPKLDPRYEPFVVEEVGAGRLRFYLLQLAESVELDEEVVDEQYNTSFDRALLVAPAAFEDAFDFRLEETYDAATGFPTRRRLDSAILACIGWLTESIPILLLIASTRSAETFAQLRLDAESLRGMREQVLLRMVWYYRAQVEHADKRVSAAEAMQNSALDEYDRLVGVIEEVAGDWFEQPPGLKQVIELHEHNKRSRWAVLGAALAALAVILLAVVL